MLHDTLKGDRISVRGTLGQVIHEQILVVTGHIPMVAVQLMQQEGGGFADIHFMSQQHVNFMRVIHSSRHKRAANAATLTISQVHPGASRLRTLHTSLRATIIWPLAIGSDV
jgi:hypothetical protein